MNNVEVRNEKVQAFNNEMFGEIRTVTIDGEPWFVAYDIANVLGYKPTKIKGRHTKHVNDMLRVVESEDKQTIRGRNSIDEDLADIAFYNNSSVHYVNESGLYTLIMRSQAPNAKAFKKWVTKEVLPTIRKTGGYVQENRAIDFVNAWLPQVDDTTKHIVAGTLEQNQKLVTENKQLVTTIEEQSPKVGKYEEWLDTDGTMNPTTLKDFLGFKSPQALNKWLKEQGIQYKKGGSWNITAKYKYLIEEGYVKIVTNTTYNVKQIRWTTKGLDLLKDILG